MAITKPAIKPGDTVIVPRTGGYTCLGIVKSINGQEAVVRFLVGDKLRGEPHNYDPNEWASKRVPIDKLQLI